jgi:hypothetical protein
MEADVVGSRVEVAGGTRRLGRAAVGDQRVDQRIAATAEVIVGPASRRRLLV